MLAPLALSLVGFVWGMCDEGRFGLSLRHLAFLAGGILAMAGLWRGRPRGERLVAVCLIAYIVFSAVEEPLAFIDNAGEALVSVAWLSLLIIGGVLLPVRGCWKTGLGCWAVLFSGTIALGYNVSHAHSGAGFLMRWME